MVRLANKVAIVTGGGTGIGRGIAKVLAEHGAHIVVCGRREAPLLETCALIGDNCSSAVVDVSDEESCKALVDGVLKSHGRIDILVNNAGIVSDTEDAETLENRPVSEFDKIMAINVRSQFILCKAVIPHMKERSQTLKEKYATFEEASAARPHAGAIINLFSIAGERGFATLSPYSTSKFAIVGLTRTLALELAPFHITVNALLPGIVWTEMWDELATEIGKKTSTAKKDEVFKKSVETLIPMKTAQLPEDMGEAALYLATAPNTTGQSLAVDGGYLA